MMPQPTYNHLLTICAQIDTIRDGDSLTAQEVREAFLMRLARLDDVELLEAVEVMDTVEPD